MNTPTTIISQALLNVVNANVPSFAQGEADAFIPQAVQQIIQDLSAAGYRIVAQAPDPEPAPPQSPEESSE